MTTLLQQAFDQAATLPEAEQELLASRLLAEFAKSNTNGHQVEDRFKADDTAPLPDALRVELERRLADSIARPDAVTPWEVIEAKALARARK